MQHFDPVTCLRQLRYSGLMDTAKVRKAGYSVRLTYLEFAKRYLHLIHGSPKRFNSRGIADQICNEHLSRLPKSSAFLGHSKVFLKKEAERYLEEELVRSYHAQAVIIQNQLRMWICRKNFIKVRKSVVALKNYWKMRQVRMEYQNVRKGIARLQARVVARRYEFRYKLLKRYITMFQAHCRGFMIRRWTLQKLVQKKQKKIMEKIKIQRTSLGTSSQVSVIENDNAEENQRVREEYKQIQQERRNKMVSANVRNMKPVIEELSFVQKLEKQKNQAKPNYILNQENNKPPGRPTTNDIKLGRNNSNVEAFSKKPNDHNEEKLLFVAHKLNMRPQTYLQLHRHNSDVLDTNDKNLVNITQYSNKPNFADKPRPKSHTALDNRLHKISDVTEPIQYVDNVFNFLNDSVDTSANVQPSTIINKSAVKHNSPMSKFFNTFRRNHPMQSPPPRKYKQTAIHS